MAWSGGGHPCVLDPMLNLRKLFLTVMKLYFPNQQPARRCIGIEDTSFIAPVLKNDTSAWMDLITFALMGHTGAPQVLWGNVRTRTAFGSCCQVNKGLI